MSTNFIEVPELTLQAAIGTGDTEIIVTGAYRYDGTIITEADFGGSGAIIYATLEPKTARQESVACTWVSNVDGVLTMSVTRALSGVAPYSTGGVAYTHSSGSAFIFGNSAALFNKLAAKDNNEVITGEWDFPETPTGNLNPVTKKHMEDTAVIKTGAQTIAGVKTFSDAPKIPDSGAADEAVTRGELDAEEVKLTGNQTIAGVKTFSSSPVVPNATAAQHPLTKAQFDASTQEAVSKATEVIYGSVKLDRASIDPAVPIAISKSSVVNESTRDVDPTQDAEKIVELEADGYFNTLTFGKKTLPFVSYEPADGSTTPVPVGLNTSGNFIKSGLTNAERQHFIGFLKSDNTSFVRPSFLSSTPSGVTGDFAVSAPAGNNRVMIVFTNHQGAGPSIPTAFSWNGISFTKLQDYTNGGNLGSMWIAKIGSSVSTQNINLIMTGGGGTYVRYAALVYQNVDSVTAYNDSDKNTTSGTSISTPSITSLHPYSLYVYGMFSSNGTVTLSTSGVTHRVGPSSFQAIGDVNVIGDSILSATSSFSSTLGIMGLVLNAANSSPEVDIHCGNIVNGFTGLTIGKNYYIQNTAGTIGVTPGSPEILVGKAISTTELLVTHN